ncbi:hypothetical protein QP027_03140 [Corynebacterium breve]|uniref:Serine hydrolase n=1 Tax=Corynebacterium breve TaxID=3049799 RepID=A0ABY8VHL0_9CORY|nr:hypothetical protein [Corynebacterium breve]WIM68998.1 hypothetical protein QP027_03140 [Corynebacterium breve]
MQLSRWTRTVALTATVGFALSGCTIEEMGSSQSTGQTLTVTSTTTVEDSPEVPTPTATPAAGLQPQLQAIVDESVETYGGSAGLAVSDGRVDTVAGDDTAYPAWSTSKVPIAIAAVRQDPSLQQTAALAIQFSDNAAAETLWAALPPSAADRVISEADTPLVLNTEVTRPGFTAFGQTSWSTSSQAHFAANLGCVEGAEPILQLMGEITPEHRYGIGNLPGAKFKGGWGPNISGAYVVRQLGALQAPNGRIAVAMTAAPGDGSYQSAQDMMNLMAERLNSLIDELPASKC